MRLGQRRCDRERYLNVTYKKYHTESFQNEKRVEWTYLIVHQIAFFEIMIENAIIIET